MVGTFIVLKNMLTIIPVGVYYMSNETQHFKKGGTLMEYTTQIQNRVKRIEGQLRGVLRMMEEGKDCKEVITQLSAARSAIDRTMGLVVSTNLVECALEAERTGESVDEMIQEAVGLLVKSR